MIYSQQYQPLEVVVETSPAWPWLFDRLQERGIDFVLAHAKRAPSHRGVQLQE